MDAYVSELLVERDSLPESSHGYRLIDQEILRVKDGENNGYNRSKSVIPGEEIVKLEERVFVPVRQFPKFNFVGKILGPRGNTLKRLQQQTQTRLSVLGRGSMKDKEKEEELRNSEEEKHQHLKDELHVLINVEAPKSEAHARLAGALSELKQLMRPENDEVRKEQMRELAAMKEGEQMQNPAEGGNPALGGGGAPEDQRFEVSPHHQIIRGGGGHPPPMGHPAPRHMVYPAGIPAGLPPGTIIIPAAAAHEAMMPRRLPPGARIVHAGRPMHHRVAPPSRREESFPRYEQYETTYEPAYEGYPETAEPPPVYYEYAAEKTEYPPPPSVRRGLESRRRGPSPDNFAPTARSGSPGEKRFRRDAEAYEDVKYPTTARSSLDDEPYSRSSTSSSRR